MTEPKTSEISMFKPEEKFTGRNLENLVIGIEAAIGGYKAGRTPLGTKIIRICEDALEEDRLKTKQP